MTGRIDGKSDYVNLTDGGHLENLGVYELLRRQCKFIIACDAEADPDRKFGSLARAIRFARIDWGIQIDIDVTDLGKDAHGQSLKGYALGRIRYPDNAVGYLLYIKSSLLGNENRYVKTYAAVNPAFPHESTGDQFFSEAQFEAYRSLGHKIATTLCDRVDPSKFVDDPEKPARVGRRNSKPLCGPAPPHRADAWDVPEELKALPSNSFRAKPGVPFPPIVCAMETRGISSLARIPARGTRRYTRHARSSSLRAIPRSSVTILPGVLIVADHPHLGRETEAIASALHTYSRQLAQSDRNLLRPLDSQGDPTQHLQVPSGTGPARDDSPRVLQR